MQYALSFLPAPEQIIPYPGKSSGSDRIRIHNTAFIKIILGKIGLAHNSVIVTQSAAWDHEGRGFWGRSRQSCDLRSWFDLNRLRG